MAKKGTRLFVALEPVLYANVQSLSKINGTTPSMAARELIRMACESIEDIGLAAMAERREAKVDRCRWLRHDEVWK